MKKMSSIKDSIYKKALAFKKEASNVTPDLSADQYNQSKTRDSGLELYRIVLMILIIAHHYVVNSGLLQSIINSSFSFSPNNVFLIILSAWGKVGINCFVLITGFFMCKGKITCKKFLKLLLEILFYNIIIYLIFIVTGFVSFDLKTAFQTIVPIYGIGTSFTTSFLVFYLFIPFVNVLVQNLNKYRHFLLIVLSLSIYSLLPSIFKAEVILDYVFWFMILYFIASYLRFYPLKKDKDIKFWAISTISFIIIDIIGLLTFMYICMKMDKIGVYFLLIDSNKILAVLTAISAFQLFKNIRFKSKIINFISASTFGVLLIHANSDAMRNHLLKTPNYYSSNYLVLHAILSIIGIYIVCTIIDIARRYIFEQPLFTKLDKILKK